MFKYIYPLYPLYYIILYIKNKENYKSLQTKYCLFVAKNKAKCYNILCGGDAMEIEVKLSPVPQCIAEEILGRDELFICETTVYTMEADYFDTPDGKLKKEGLSLRLRRENERSVCCLKYRVSELARFEAEENATDIQSGVTALCARDDLPESAKDVLRSAELVPIYSSSFERKCRLMVEGLSLIELSFDYGVLKQENRLLFISEIELELKEGNDYDLLELTERLCNEYSIRPCKDTKAQRAAALTEEAFAKMLPVPGDALGVNDMFSGLFFAKTDGDKLTFYRKV